MDDTDYQGLVESLQPTVLQPKLDDEYSPFKGYWARICDLYENTKNTALKDEIIDYCKRLNQTSFNVTFREQLADVIETTSWDNSTLQCEFLASYVILKFIQAIDVAASTMNIQDQMAAKWKAILDEYYRNNSMNFVLLMKQNLETETRILQYVPQEETQNAVLGNQYEIQKRLDMFDKMKQEIIYKFATQLSPMNQNLMGKVYGNLSFWDLDHHLEYPTWNDTSKKNYNDIKNERETLIVLKQEIAQLLASYADESSMLLNQILFQIKQWQRMKAYEYNGKSCPDACNIETLSIWCKRFTRILAECYGLSRNLEAMSMLDVPQFRDERLASILLTMTKYKEMIKNIISKSLVIEQHPPQVSKWKKKFDCRLRLLIGDALDIHKKLFHCEVSLISDEVYERVKNENVHTKLVLSGKINLKNREFEGTEAEFEEHSKHLKVCMRGMTLEQNGKEIVSTAELVAEKKVCMVFRATITTGIFSDNVATEIYAQAFTLPIVVISHGKQEPAAQATIFWDNAFSEMDRSKFDVRQSVPWSQMQVELNCRWRKDCGLGLSQEALEFLTMKLFGCENGNLISWKDFNKNKSYYCHDGDFLQDCSNHPPDKVTFWTWFYRIMELVRHKHLNKYWNDELIHGFLTKHSCMQKLLDHKIPVGTFLFRFSDTLLGAISIVCKERDDNGNIFVNHYVPDTLKGLDVTSLAKTVLDLEEMQYFYTGRPKKEVLAKYLPIDSNPIPKKENRTGYTKKGAKVCKMPSALCSLS